ncbi:DUF488 domain-containing protein [Marinicrinis lubricantis]|uniref:DUF488 domain-containing protein n=1 Tax=Marinicrinis lubricantis TaxID=2086470 RepID=A0ABW1IRW5_9BACL
MSNIQIKRVYAEALPSDGRRVLVDRLWPRGLTKEQAAVHVWMKEIAPSHELRKWFHHDPAQFDAFKEKYKRELQQDAGKLELLKQLREWEREDILTFVYSAKDPHNNQAILLKQWIENNELDLD